MRILPIHKEKGSAGVEFALAAAMIAFLIYMTLQLFTLIDQATDNALLARQCAFEILEDLQESDGCEKGEINSEEQRTITVTGPAKTYRLWDRFIMTNLQLPKQSTIWVGHLK